MGGNTHLIGAAIASTADASRNHLSTDSLTVEDLKNESDYKSSGMSVAGGSGSSMVSVAAGTALSMLGNSSGNSSSTTKSDIAAGTVDVRNGDQTALAGLDRTASELQQSGLKDIFDQKKLAEQKELSGLMGEVGFRAAGDLADKAGWPEGSTERALLHGAVGAAMAALGGGDALSGAASAVANQLAIKKVAEYLGEHFGEDSPEFKTLLQLASTAIGAAVDGANGAAVALSATQNNYLNHPERMAYLKAATECAKTGQSCGVAEQYEEKSNARNEALKQACMDRSSAGCQAALSDAMRAEEDQKAHQAEYASWMKDNFGELAALSDKRGNEALMAGVVTHTATSDLEHKITCAMAGSTCSDPALALQVYLGNVPADYATQDALLRAALTGVGTQVGSVTRVGETVVGIGETVWTLTPYERLKSSYNDLRYVQENGIGATLGRNFDQLSSAAGSLVGGVKDYVTGIGSAIATDALGSWDIYDLYEQGKTQGKVGVDILSLLIPGAGAAGKVGIVEGAAAKTADDVIDAINAARSTASKGANPGYPKLPPGDTVRFIADSAGNTIDLHYTNGLMETNVTVAGTRGGVQYPLQGQNPNSYANLGNGHVVVYGPEGRALYDVSNARIKVIEWNQAPNGTYFPKKGSDTKAFEGNVPQSVLDKLGLK